MSVITRDDLKAIFGMLGELLDRATRTETRMVNLMKQVGLDPHTGKPVTTKDGGDEKVS